MTDRTETDTERTDAPQAPIRRAWHPPKFFLTEIASTDAVCNGGTDGGPMSSSS
jgi:hypothetical protein